MEIFSQTSLDDKHLLPERPGVYFVHIGNKVLYIGKARNLKRRWVNHQKFPALDEMVGDITISYLVMSEDLLTDMERGFITMFDPPLNDITIPIKKPFKRSKKTHGELIAAMVDNLSQYEDKGHIFERHDIPRKYYYNATSRKHIRYKGQPSCTTQWGISLTKETHNYEWIKSVSADCGCLCLSPEDLEALDSENVKDVIILFHSLVSLVKELSAQKDSA